MRVYLQSWVQFWHSIVHIEFILLLVTFIYRFSVVVIFQNLKNVDIVCIYDFLFF